MIEAPKTVFVTQYALTEGIREVLLLREPEGHGYAVVKWREQTALSNGEQLFHDKHYHYTREAAVTRAEVMRSAKIASHEKSIAKLQMLSFVDLPRTAEHTDGGI